MTRGSSPEAGRVQQSSPRTRLLVVLPTYNEALNLPLLIPRILVALENADVLVVDDGSPDGTAAVADGLAERSAGRVFGHAADTQEWQGQRGPGRIPAGIGGSAIHALLRDGRRPLASARRDPEHAHPSPRRSGSRRRFSLRTRCSSGRGLVSRPEGMESLFQSADQACSASADDRLTRTDSVSTVAAPFNVSPSRNCARPDSLPCPSGRSSCTTPGCPSPRFRAASSTGAWEDPTCRSRRPWAPLGRWFA